MRFLVPPLLNFILRQVKFGIGGFFMQDFEKQGNGEKEIPIDFGDRVPKQRNRVTLLSRIKTDDGCVGIIFEEILLNDKQTGNDVVNSDPSETT